MLAPGQKVTYDGKPSYVLGPVDPDGKVAVGNTCGIYRVTPQEVAR